MLQKSEIPEADALSLSIAVGLRLSVSIPNHGDHKDSQMDCTAMIQTRGRESRETFSLLFLVGFVEPVKRLSMRAKQVQPHTTSQERGGGCSFHRL